MKKFTYILAFFILTSCNYFEKKKIVITDDLVQEKLQQVNRNKIDKYPIFEACERVDNNIQLEKECFTTTLSEHITDYLAQQNIVLTQPLQDTLYIQLQVDQKGTLRVQNFQIPDSVLITLPNVKQVINESIKQLPLIKPAYKKLPQTGELIPVTTQFRIPIVISE